MELESQQIHMKHSRIGKMSLGPGQARIISA